MAIVKKPYRAGDTWPIQFPVQANITGYSCTVYISPVPSASTPNPDATITKSGAAVTIGAYNSGAGTTTIEFRPTSADTEAILPGTELVVHYRLTAPNGDEVTLPVPTDVNDPVEYHLVILHSASPVGA